jgi:hypothetical protein
MAELRFGFDEARERRPEGGGAGARAARSLARKMLE